MESACLVEIVKSQRGLGYKEQFYSSNTFPNLKAVLHTSVYETLTHTRVDETLIHTSVDETLIHTKVDEVLINTRVDETLIHARNFEGLTCTCSRNDKKSSNSAVRPKNLIYTKFEDHDLSDPQCKEDLEHRENTTAALA
ncbi:hypothetical protein Avbf_14060 [Armadillidium vulgare]|nr:hypothetical protein Avbf_14060 [Armadillidium vulgare]